MRILAKERETNKTHAKKKKKKMVPLTNYYNEMEAGVETTVNFLKQWKMSRMRK